MDPWIREVAGGIEVDVWVVPGSSRDAVVGPHGNALKVRVSAPPEGGRANDAVAALLSEHFGASATLLRGHTSRSKTYRIAFWRRDAPHPGFTPPNASSM